MNQPLVVAVCLTHDRPEMLKRAVRSFQAQTYPNAMFFGLDTGEKSAKDAPYGEKNATTVWMPDQRTRTTGELRNIAIGTARGWRSFEVVVHWDDDDWSHPNRITEQVALLQASGKDCVGYRDMLFWRNSYDASTGRYDWNPETQRPIENVTPVSEAWLYCNKDTRYALGTSLCYWRKTWERNKFKPVSSKEDSYFVRGCDTYGVSMLGQMPSMDMLMGRSIPDTEPRMIASIHGGNTGGGYHPFPPDPERWKRVPEWDNHCREIMEGK